MTKRSSSTRDRHRAAIRRTRPPCGICHQPIDYTLHHLDPMSYTVDHVVPLAAGGPDTLENKQAAHRKCNRDKWHHTDRDAYMTRPRTFVTDRTW